MTTEAVIFGGERGLDEQIGERVRFQARLTRAVIRTRFVQRIAD